MKLLEIRIDAPPIRGMNFGSISLVNPEGKWLGWRISIRGASVLLVAPAGWAHGDKPHERDAKAPQPVFEVPRMSCAMKWEIADPAELSKLQSFDSDILALPGLRSDG